MVKKHEVLEAIKTLRKYNSETNRIEVKKALKGFPKSCYDTFSSFSNKYGGIIIFGLDEENNFKTEGVYDINDLQKRITSLCSDSMVPSIRCDILPLEFEGKNILAVKLEELDINKKPCYYRPRGLVKGSYTREGDSDQLMTDYEIYALQSYNDHIIEDKRLNNNSSVDDLNIPELYKYIEKIKLDKPNFSRNTFEKSLKLCGIVDNVHGNIFPTLAGTMVFGEYPQSFYPQLFVACTVIPGTCIGDIGDFGERFLDNKRIEGTIEEMLEGTMSFLKRNMRNSVIIDSNGKRVNRTQYPLEALREAVANALIHRDYSAQSENAYISVYMYSDRIEIVNPGGLYGTNRLENLGTVTVMEARNPNIVRLLEEKGSVIENRHSGIPTMKREMAKYNLPYPEFYEERGSFKVIFRSRKQFSDTQIEESDTQIEKSDTQIEESDTQIEESDTQIEKSDTQIEESDTQIEKGGQQKELGGQQSEPSGQQNEPSGQQSEPSGQQSEPSGQQNEPSGQQNEPSGQQNEPGGQQSIPGGQQIKSLDEYKKMLLKYCVVPRTAKEIVLYLKIKSRQYISTNIIKPLISEGKLDYTNKNSVNARNQKYVTVDNKYVEKNFADD